MWNMLPCNWSHGIIVSFSRSARYRNLAKQIGIIFCQITKDHKTKEYGKTNTLYLAKLLKWKNYLGKERQTLAYHGIIMIILITTKSSEDKAYIDQNVISYHYFFSPFVLIEAGILVGTDSLLATNCKLERTKFHPVCC